MRLWGMALLVAGVLGFFYATTRLAGATPVPPGVELGDYLQYEAGKWELARYGAAMAGLIGILLTMFPKGR